MDLPWTPQVTYYCEKIYLGWAYVQGHVYTDGSICAAFLANYDVKTDATVKFREQAYHLPAWSVSILPDCKNVIYNTAQVLCFSFFKLNSG